LTIHIIKDDSYDYLEAYENENLCESSLYENSENSLYENEENNEEKWLVDRISPSESVMILKNFKECFKTGTFLIRISSSNPKNLCLSIL
jgi:hypothetical protein